MLETIEDGNYYITNRKNQEKTIITDFDGVEGFDVVSRLSQKKNPSRFYIPQDVDPGQMVMCKEMSKIRYIKLNKLGDFLNIQQVEVYDENGINVALVKKPGVGTPVATMSSSYGRSNPYMALDWPNIAHTGVKSGGWWQVDLGKLVNVKKIVIHNRRWGHQTSLNRLNGTVLSLMDDNYTVVWTATLNSNSKQEFIFNTKTCGGPVVEKNLEDFEELQELQTQYNRQLQLYNQAIQERLDNSRKYINISNTFNNKYANKYVRDKSNGQLGYVTKRGVYKAIPSANAKIADGIAGKKGCPASWRGTANRIDYIQPRGEKKISHSSIPVGQVVKINGVQLIKGTNMTAFESCDKAGNDIFITEKQELYNINLLYNKLNAILEKIHSKIIQLGSEDSVLNKRLISEYNLLKTRLNKYNQVYNNIGNTSELIKHGAALEEDSNLNMLSNDKIFLLWSIVAMGITAGAIKFMR